MNYLILLSGAFLMLLQFESALCQEDQLDPSCFFCKCPRNLDFECGSDGRTYQNDCMFKCAQEKCPEKTRRVVITRKGQCSDQEEKEVKEVKELKVDDYHYVYAED
eukprot:GFUD01026550.1.p1 GENE.GFUD01026550.1~~GFUD01026550.1.p1  ORF type:complete len:106 (-),score=28.93 GFUD01026550.1:104-421(-)